VIATMSFETPALISSRLLCSTRKANSRLPKAMPTGLLRPSSGTAMQAKPRPDWKVVP
jgi:hypothetical protein